MTQARAVFRFNLVGELLVGFEQFAENSFRNHVKQGVFQCADRETYPLPVQQAKLAEVATFGEPVVQRAVAAENLHGTTAYHIPGNRFLTELDNLRSGLEVAHVDRSRDPVQTFVGQLAERRETPQEFQNLELLVLHAYPPSLRVVRKPVP